MGLYNDWVLPRLICALMQNEPISRQRKKVVPRARGQVLEIGIGPGLNLPFYDPAKVERVIGLDPSDVLMTLGKKRIADAPFPVESIGLKAEEIPLADESVDTVLLTYTLCTIPDVAKALKGMRRVLKPSGVFIFCEHGKAPDPGVSLWQNRINPLWQKITGGCNLNRPIPTLISEAGLVIDTLDEMYVPGTPRIAGYNYWGSAKRA